jgi:NIPSNAP
MNFYLSLILALGVSLVNLPIAFTQTTTNQYYSLTEYQGIDPTRLSEFDAYFEKALIPGLKQQGIENVGVLNRTKLHEDGTTSLFLLIPLANPSQLPNLIEQLSKDSAFLNNAKDYLETDYKKPIYARARSELLLAFDCFPKLHVPSQKATGKDRLFELRVYESPNELMGHLKVEMFNSGELPIFTDCGIQPVFMGQALVGDKLPNLTYMTVYDNSEQRDECWKRFQKHPDWQVLKAEKKYEGTVSKIHKIDLVPRPYSQL